MFDIIKLLEEAVARDASDLFITVGVPPTFKIHGNLVPFGEKKLTPQESEKLVKSLFSRDEFYGEFLAFGEKDFSFSLKGVGRFRIDAYTQRGSHAAAIRVLKFEKLNPEMLEIPGTVLDFRKRTKGLVLITGPTGSGKSTTLSCIIDQINKERACHILTLEDPIEYVHRHDKSIVDQREVGIDTRSYADGLRSALRQAPDVILIGEMRDLETMSIALTAAETGHLVFSTLHTVGAAKTIDRIIDVFPSNQQQQVRVQLSTVLQGVVSQQLVSALSGDRVPAFEIMSMNHAIRNLIREGKVHQIEAAMHSGSKEGMVNMDAALADLVKAERISIEEAELHSISLDSLKRYLSR
ncbi:type IV pilus twitching motility protein PilT [Fusibacter tunisiensis]|uniref:Twitching motility protein PilT n=1 Tax=Fusibacter tunisiensis TaxID=1008308 RepID=A0ABS2MQB5_9FIRM|nr:type IV pilus twitching motility protein PilT [Fusibacter tunisiensis]MBM7561591.1 twitching motility protein PilT [Fusibacter tunisiensis]